jgi:hypothetical protein
VTRRLPQTRVATDAFVPRSAIGSKAPTVTPGFSSASRSPGGGHGRLFLVVRDGDCMRFISLRRVIAVLSAERLVLLSPEGVGGRS